MRFELLRNRVRAAVFLVTGFACGVVSQPLWRSTVVAVFSSDFRAAVKECDGAMRTHFLAKATLKKHPSDEAIRGLREAELGLLSCHDYDLLQKRMILWGLRENELSLLRLEAAESHDNLDFVVQEHEIRY